MGALKSNGFDHTSSSAERGVSGVRVTIVAVTCGPSGNNISGLCPR